MSGCGGNPLNLENVRLKSPHISGEVTFDTAALNSIASALGTGGAGGGGVSDATLAAMIADAGNTTLRSAITNLFTTCHLRGLPIPLEPGEQLVTCSTMTSGTWAGTIASQLAAIESTNGVGSYLYIMNASGLDDPDAYPPSAIGYAGTWERCTISTSGETFVRSGGYVAPRSEGTEILWHRVL